MVTVTDIRTNSCNSPTTLLLLYAFEIKVTSYASNCLRLLFLDSSRNMDLMSFFKL